MEINGTDLGLQVAMHNFVEMAIFNTGDNLVKKAAGFIRRQAPSGHYVVEELPPGNIFHNYEYVRRRVDNLVQPDDVGVGAHLQDVDLSANFLRHFHVLDSALVQDFNCYFLAGDDMVRH